MFCKYCGKEIGAEAKICSYCGQVLDDSTHNKSKVEEPAPAVEVKEEPKAEEVKAEEPKTETANDAKANTNTSNASSSTSSSSSSCSFNPYDKIFEEPAPSIGWGFLGFFFPLIGLILYLVWQKEFPKKAKMVGKGALIGVIFNVASSILSTLVFTLVPSCVGLLL